MRPLTLADVNAARGPQWVIESESVPYGMGLHAGLSTAARRLWGLSTGGFSHKLLPQIGFATYTAFIDAYEGRPWGEVLRAVNRAAAYAGYIHEDQLDGLEGASAEGLSALTDRAIRLLVKGNVSEARAAAQQRGIPVQAVAETESSNTVLRAQAAYWGAISRWFEEPTVMHDEEGYPPGSLLWFNWEGGDTPHLDGLGATHVGTGMFYPNTTRELVDHVLYPSPVPGQPPLDPNAWWQRVYIVEKIIRLVGWAIANGHEEADNAYPEAPATVRIYSVRRRHVNAEGWLWVDTFGWGPNDEYGPLFSLLLPPALIEEWAHYYNMRAELEAATRGMMFGGRRDGTTWWHMVFEAAKGDEYMQRILDRAKERMR